MYEFVDTNEPATTTNHSIKTIFNDKNLDDELTDSSGRFRTLTVSGRGNNFNRLELIEVPGLDGAVEPSSPFSNPLEINVKFLIEDDTNEGFQKRVEKLKHFLKGRKKILEFTDEKAIRYATLLELVLPEEETNSLVANIIFVLSDPHKYGYEEEHELEYDVTLVENTGNEPTAPIIELTALKPVTYAMVENGAEEYNLIGFPLEEGGREEVVNSRELVFKETGSTFNSWLNSPQVYDTNFSIANGSLTADPTGIYADNYGSSTDKNHGGYKIKELSESIQDFRVETHFDVDTPNDDETFRIEVYMIADDLTIIGKIGMLDGSSSVKRRVGLVRAGSYVGHGKNYTHYSGNYNHDRVGSSQTWYLRFIREGDLIRTRIARRLRGEQVRGKNGRIYTYDIPNADKPLKYIGVYIGYYKETRRPRLARINHIDVYKLNKIQEDQTPYILYEGDKLLLDHAEEKILINGEDAMPLKHFGAEFWNLFPGYNNVIVSPPGSFEGNVRFKEKYK